MVVGPDVEEQLQPFHEFECTGENDQYVQDIDKTEEARKNYEPTEVKTFAEWIEGEYGYKVVPYGEQPDIEGEHKYGYTIVDKNGDVVKTIDRTNVNAKWDWWTIGGRWNGYLKVKKSSIGLVRRDGFRQLTWYKAPGQDQADQCFKGDIDIERMRQEAADKAAKEYDLFTSLTAGLPPIETWDSVVKKHDKNYEAARTEYHAQPGVKAIRENVVKTIEWDLKDFIEKTRDQYIHMARNKALATFAMLKDGVWYERGEMGWFACVSDEKDDWDEQFNAMFDALPDNTMLTIVDCHI
jgi:hypothetical protein